MILVDMLSMLGVPMTSLHPEAMMNSKCLSSIMVDLRANPTCMGEGDDSDEPNYLGGREGDTGGYWYKKTLIL